MKKIFVALVAFALPATAHAEVQSAPKTMPEATVQAAIKEFADPWCKTGLQGLVDSVKQCFKTTSENSPDLDKCILGHYALSRVTKYERKISAEKGADDPTENIPYISYQKTQTRGSYYINLPRYNHDGAKYFIPGIKKVGEQLDRNLSKCPVN